MERVRDWIYFHRFRLQAGRDLKCKSCNFSVSRLFIHKERGPDKIYDDTRAKGRGPTRIPKPLNAKPLNP